MTYAYRKAEESDSESIYQLYRLTMQSFISEIWGWNEPWQRADFTSHFDHQGIMLACQKHELAGYSHIENQDRQIFIRMIVVHPHHQRNGIGTKFLTSVIASAGSRRVELEVFKINEVAKAFYERHGFNVEGETPSSFVMVHT